MPNNRGLGAKKHLRNGVALPRPEVLSVVLQVKSANFRNEVGKLC